MLATTACVIPSVRCVIEKKQAKPAMAHGATVRVRCIICEARGACGRVLCAIGIILCAIGITLCAIAMAQDHDAVTRCAITSAQVKSAVISPP